MLCLASGDFFISHPIGQSPSQITSHWISREFVLLTTMGLLLQATGAFHKNKYLHLSTFHERKFIVTIFYCITASKGPETAMYYRL